MPQDEINNLHKGHRRRRRELIAREGLDSLADHELLEYLLFFVRPHIDTNELAHRLLLEFGSLRAVFDAEPEDLLRVSGIGEHSAQFIALVPALARRYFLARSNFTPHFYTVGQVTDHLRYFLLDAKLETSVIMLMDNDRALLKDEIICEGSYLEVPLYVRRVVESALRAKARYVALAHNHLSNSARPSSEDNRMTKQLKNALSLVDIELSDHIIVCLSDNYYSYAEHGVDF